MSSMVQVILTRLSDGSEFEGVAWKDNEKYEAIWHEGGLRFVFFFNEDGTQVGPPKYSLRAKSV